MKRGRTRGGELPTTSPCRRGRSSPQEDLHPELLAGAGGLADGLNLGVEPESPLVRRLQVVVDHHTHAHLELVPPQQGPGAWSHIYGLHGHDAILRVTVRAGLRSALCFTSVSLLYYFYSHHLNPFVTFFHFHQRNTSTKIKCISILKEKNRK